MIIEGSKKETCGYCLCVHGISSLSKDYGEKMFDDDVWLMEVKINKNLPLWFARVLAENEVYQNSFSKYGTAYTKFILPELRVTSVIRTRPKA